MYNVIFGEMSRIQCHSLVKVGQAISAHSLCTSGVAQGSVLGGGLLFTVYISPIGRVIDSYADVRYHKYADDTQVYIELKNNSSHMGPNASITCSTGFYPTSCS